MGRHRAAESVLVSSLLLCVLFAGCGKTSVQTATGGGADRSTATTTVAPGQLVFEVTEGLGQYNGSGTLWVINTDGVALKKLADGPRGYRLEYPAWSPDGQKIAYHLGVYHWGTGWLDTHSVWVMNSDATKQAQLTRLPVGCLGLRGRLTEPRSPSLRTLRRRTKLISH